MNLKEIRQKRGLSQGDVASRLGCSANVYSRYERGERQPSIDVLIGLSKILDVSVDFIIGNHEIESASLSGYELELVKESRTADERAKQDVLLLLRNHKVL
ncbi:MAG: helix-turn-helix transcriptional regulator [Clostridiales bacterium]|nr:helix-turn-helix transcriptional regulator [Clostridiales bacterium]